VLRGELAEGAEPVMYSSAHKTLTRRRARARTAWVWPDIPCRNLIDRATFVLCPYIDRHMRSWDPYRREHGEINVRRNHSLWETLAGTLGTVEVTVLASGEDVRAAEREQWDDSNNYLAVASGVVIGYERNVAPTPCCASTGSRSPPWRARNSAAAGADPLHDLPHRARPCLAGSAQRASRVIPPQPPGNPGGAAAPKPPSRASGRGP
jgi:hypothetical protein